MEKLSHGVKELFEYATPEEKRFIRKSPSLKNIQKDIERFNLFFEKGERKGRRVGMGEVGIIDGKVVGYHAFSVMKNASATSYERKNIDMGNGLNYVYSKKLFVHPDFRGNGIGTGFVSGALDLASKLGLHYIIDVEKDNFLMVNILSQCELPIDFPWSTPQGVEMNRFYRD